MKLTISTALLSIIGAMAFGSAAAFAEPALMTQPGLERIQYNQYPDQYNQDRRGGYDQDQRGGYDRDQRYGDSRPPFRWRPGQVVPGQAMNFVVQDWEERGLLRPPGGHQWFRVRQQFLLIRVRDRMISRVVTFD